ncbi:MAG: 2-amino-4-hydroxy-6-hydroxymethyldihydropteridine diphosphokinase [Alphaproteobacteria bacterium]|jgi:2-amino-4-hydroxy-6-hydroxymethyldihydropteridine diphosphokinase|nr:2-amino-4-hydroxy-6-hydroxymethyldihydropteridine diphosphokinase [Alphaproteobacteria bacterium]
MTPVLLGLGSNLGDRAVNLQAAINGLKRFLNVTAVSPIYESDPMYETEQPCFLNLVAAAETAMTPAALLDALKRLETRLGRLPTRVNGPRVIDIDILFYGDRVVRTEALSIPHPGMAERAFVLAPASDIAPDWPCPATGRRVREMLAALRLDGAVRRYAPA